MARQLTSRPLLAAVAVALTACGGENPVLEACRPQIRDIEVAVTTNGRIEASGAVALHAPVAGRVESLDSALGAALAKGELVLTIADSGQIAARDRAEARLKAAQAELERFDEVLRPTEEAGLRAQRSKLSTGLDAARGEVARHERLLAGGAVSSSELEGWMRKVQELQTEIDAVEVQLEALRSDGPRELLEAAVTQAELELTAARQAVSNRSVRAPAAGRLYSLPVAEGDFVETGNLLARLGSTEKVRARVFVDEPDLGNLRPAAVATLSADAYPGIEWACRIHGLPEEIVAIGPRRVGDAFCTVDNSDGLLLPGLAVGVRVVVKRAEGVLSVPREAIAREGEGGLAWILQDGVLDRREIELGAVGPAHVEVRGGIAASDVVVLPGDLSLRHGQPARARIPGEPHGG